MQTYVEKNKGKLKKYRILRGKHLRIERTEAGALVPVQYTSNENCYILLTMAGAISLSSSMDLKLVDDDRAVKVRPAIEIPEDWDELSKAKKLALATALADRRIKDLEEAMGVIETEVTLRAANAGDSSEEDGDGSGDTDNE